jgi:hypothetical protein
MDTGKHWWFCLKHHEVEPDAGCPGKWRLGPFATRDEAANALQNAQRRNEEWEAQDGAE